MNLFKQIVYSIVKSQNCLPINECPAVQAELEDKPGDEVCRICDQCWNKLHQKQR